ncbi:MAG: hypothetical protein AB7K71_21630 [Polyangiaceae bacterium]
MDEGVATAEQIVAALDEQLARTTQFGKLALGKKLLTIPQIWQVLNHQADHGGRFGEIAALLGFLTENQVQDILVLQLASRPKIGELLVEAGVVSAESMKVLLERYRVRRLTQVLGPVPEAEQDEWPGGRATVGTETVAQSELIG